MSTKIKNTLFRFTSLRAPELVEEHNNKDGFVTRPNVTEVTNGVFDTAIQGLTEGETKWQVLYEAAVENFQASAYSLDQIKALNTSLYDFSVWLAKNRSSFELADFESKLSSASGLSNENLGILWDNLFYQVLTQDDFYIKETIIQLLIANHAVSKYIPEDFDRAKALAYAKVILPATLFSEDTPVIKGHVAQATIDATVPSSTMSRQRKVARAQMRNAELKALSKGLKRAEKIYKKEYKTALEQALDSHKKIVDPILRQYEKDVDAANQSWCSTANSAGVDYDPKDPCKRPPAVDKPVLPEFVFEHTKALDFNYLKSKLGTENHDRLQEFIAARLGESAEGMSEEVYDGLIEDLDGFSDLRTHIDDAIAENNSTISENSTNDETIHVGIGEILVPVNQGSTRKDFSYHICSEGVKQNGANPSLGTFMGDIEITIPDESWELASFDYEVKQAESLFTNDLAETYAVTTIDNRLFINNIELGLHTITDDVNLTSFNATIVFTNGIVKTIEIPKFSLVACSIGQLLNEEDESSTDDNQSPFVPSGFGFRQLGIADYNKVEQTTQGYVEGDVAHIENIMAREFKERSTRRLRRKEDSITTGSETEREQLTDTTSTQRFEMQNEVANVIQEGNDFAANASFMGNYGASDKNSIQIGANSSFATFSSKEESTLQAVTEAQEITERALDRIVTKVKEERIEKIVEEFEENNTHGFDNRKGDKHVVGVFRWVDKVFKNQIINYGKRLMFEFMVPQPGKLHRLALKGVDMSKEFVKPTDPRTASVHVLADYEALDNTNLKYWASKFNVDIAPKPDAEIHIGKSFSQNSNDIDTGFTFSESDVIRIPENYESAALSLSTNGGSPYGIGSGAFPYDAISGDLLSIDSYTDINITDEPVPNYRGEFPISYFAVGFHGSSATVQLKCKLTLEAEKQWKQESFKAIIDAYEDAMDTYNERVAQQKANGIAIKGTNPGFYREFENKILRKNCISYLIDQDPEAKFTYGKSLFTTNNGMTEGFANTEVKVDENLDNYAAFVKFMEQAFEWNIMSYSLYPYYWGDRKDWSSLYQYSDTIDPLFKNFMQAGMARVVVTVRPGFEEAVRFYMQTGQIWNGGEVPVIEDKLYLSIIDELREPKGEKRGKAWPTRVPTSLTILQAKSIGLNVERALPYDFDSLSDFEDPDAVPQPSPTGFVDVDDQDAISEHTGTAKLMGDITGNNGIEAKVLLKRIDGSIQDLTYTDTNGSWELNNLPAGRFELLLDADNDFETYQVTEGSKDQVVELTDDEILVVDLTVVAPSS